MTIQDLMHVDGGYVSESEQVVVLSGNCSITISRLRKDHALRGCIQIPVVLVGAILSLVDL